MTDDVALQRRVLEILAAMLQVPQAELSPESSRDSVERWDSLKHMHVMLALEEEFGVEFSDGELADLASVSAIVDVLRARTRG